MHMSVSRKHCRITVKGKDFVIENLNLNNVTYVDDNPIVSKSITQLGKEHFQLPLQDVLRTLGCACLIA